MSRGNPCSVRSTPSATTARPASSGRTLVWIASSGRRMPSRSFGRSQRSPRLTRPGRGVLDEVTASAARNFKWSYWIGHECGDSGNLAGARAVRGSSPDAINDLIRARLSNTFAPRWPEKARTHRIPSGTKRTIAARNSRSRRDCSRHSGSGRDGEPGPGRSIGHGFKSRPPYGEIGLIRVSCLH
jgi:hypothetical protein